MINKWVVIEIVLLVLFCVPFGFTLGIIFVGMLK